VYNVMFRFTVPYTSNRNDKIMECHLLWKLFLLYRVIYNKAVRRGIS